MIGSMLKLLLKFFIVEINFIVNFDSGKLWKLFESIINFVRSCCPWQDREWERFLQADYDEIISILQRSSSPLASKSRKDLYDHLCTNPILIGDGALSLTLDRRNGKKCYMVGATGLTITHSETPRNWNWPSSTDSRNIFSSRFSCVAQLLEVHWFNVVGKIETNNLYSQTNYKAYLVFKFSQPRDGFDGRIFNSKIFFEGREDDCLRCEVNIPRHSLKRNDGWMEVELGQFLNEQEGHKTVACWLYDYDSNIRKSGLIIEGIEFRPHVLLVE